MSISVASGSSAGDSEPGVGGDPGETVGMYGVDVMSDGEGKLGGRPLHIRGGPTVACRVRIYSVAEMAWCTISAGPVAGCGQRQPVLLRTGSWRTWKGWPSAGTSGVAVVLGMMGHVGMGETDW